MERDRGTEDRAPRKRTRDGASSSGARPPSCDAAPAPAAPPASRAKIATSISMAKRSHPPPMSNLSLAASLGNHGIIMLLFETPSGFAIFSFHGVALLLPDAIENIWADFGRKYRANCVWLKEFRFFEDKSAAINPETGVSDELREMLMKWCSPGYKLAVGKSEYKTIIEDKLKIPCLHSDAVMEVMWGLKNLMHSLVPEEKSHLSKEDRLQMSQGLEMLLKRYGVDVKPEMVSDRIIGLACLLYDCDCMDNVHFASLRDGGRILKDVSGIGDLSNLQQL